jgi:hypothetical protein
MNKIKISFELSTESTVFYGAFVLMSLSNENKQKTKKGIQKFVYFYKVIARVRIFLTLY